MCIIPSQQKTGRKVHVPDRQRKAAWRPLVRKPALKVRLAGTRALCRARMKEARQEENRNRAEIRNRMLRTEPERLRTPNRRKFRRRMRRL